MLSKSFVFAVYAALALPAFSAQSAEVSPASCQSHPIYGQVCTTPPLQNPQQHTICPWDPLRGYVCVSNS